MQLRRALIATDFSDRSLHVARWTVNHFASDLDLVLAHVVALPEPPRFLRARFPQTDSVAQSARVGAMSRLREFARLVGVPEARLEVRVGSLAEEISGVARDTNADVVIVGRHGDRPGILHRLGATADRLVKIAPAPVLLATGLRDVKPRHLLVAVDDAEITTAVVTWARLLAERFAAELVALHVVSSPILSHIVAGACGGMESGTSNHSKIRATVVDEGARWMRGLFEAGAPPEFSTEVVFGSVAREIVAAAERDASDLIVLGRSGAGLGRRLLLGSVARQVLHTARCPVLVVDAPSDGASIRDGA